MSGINVDTLRQKAQEARKNASSAYQSSYELAADEAFNFITNDIDQKLIDAAEQGKTTVSVYSWIDGDSEQTVRFGITEENEGSHIRHLLMPNRNIPFEAQLLQRLRRHLNPDHKGDEKFPVKVFVAKDKRDENRRHIFVAFNEVRDHDRTEEKQERPERFTQSFTRPRGGFSSRGGVSRGGFSSRGRGGFRSAPRH